MGLRPLNDLVLVCLDPKAEQKGSIILIDDTNHIRTGVVRAMGPGKWVAAKGSVPAHHVKPDVEVGERVAFFSANFVTAAGEQLAEKVNEYAGEDLRLLRSTDLLFAVKPGVEVDFS